MKNQFTQGALLMAFFFFFQNIQAQVTGKVFRDFNANGVQTTAVPDPIEPGLKDVTVNAYDNSNTLFTATTDASGNYSIGGGTAPYRVEFVLPPFYYASKGSTSNTTVQFVVAVGGVANLGVNHPADYLTSIDVPLFIPILWGDSWPNAATSSHANETALKMFKESNSGLTPIPTPIATLGQIGNTWGTAFHNESKTVFASTFFRKYGGYGNGGQSAIYAIKAGIDGNFGTADDVVGTFIKLDDFFGANSTGPDAFGSILRGDSLLVSKVAYGDIEMSADAKTLYAINLHDRKIYNIPINRTADVPILGSITSSPSIPDALDCTGVLGILRPFGLAINRADNKLYVSATCEGTGKIYVWGYNTVTEIWDAAPILSHFPYDSPFPNCCWRDWNTTVGYEKPTLAMGLDFEKSGNFLNLTYINRRIYTESETNGMRNAGNVLRFCFDGTTWNIENAGAACGITGFSTSNNGGPGGGEFNDDTSVEGGEGSIMGAALQIPGRATFALTLDDPIGLYSGGIVHINNSNGTQASRYEILSNVFPYPPPPSVFDGKRNAMGDIEYLSEVQPIEIGNRVFMDTDSDGIQDPNEMGIDGVMVKLYKAGIIVDSIPTANGGQWFFTNLDADTDYEIKILGANTPSGKSLTKKDAVSTGAADVADSDAILVGSDAVIAYKTGSAGQNNHTLDFGFKVGCALSATAAGTNPTCPNNDGAIKLTVTGATGTPTYLWSNGAVTKDLSTIPAGQYTVTVTDGTCSTTATATIEVIPSNIPYSICPGETYKLEIQDNTLTGIQWKKDGIDIAGANALSYTATSAGVYTYISNGVGGCAVGQCCPIELVASTNCCKPVICTTVKITKK